MDFVGSDEPVKRKEDEQQHQTTTRSLKCGALRSLPINHMSAMRLPLRPLSDPHRADEETAVFSSELAAWLQDTDRRLEESRAKVESYRNMDKWLLTFPHRTRREVLAPLCGGLAFVRGTLVHTNELIVLLGASYFAERSCSQAREIVSRRLAFLLSEQKALEFERSGIVGRLDASSSLLAADDAPPSSSSRSSPHATTRQADIRSSNSRRSDALDEIRNVKYSDDQTEDSRDRHGTRADAARPHGALPQARRRSAGGQEDAEPSRALSGAARSGEESEEEELVDPGDDTVKPWRLTLDEIEAIDNDIEASGRFWTDEELEVLIEEREEAKRLVWMKERKAMAQGPPSPPSQPPPAAMTTVRTEEAMCHDRASTWDPRGGGEGAAPPPRLGGDDDVAVVLLSASTASAVSASTASADKLASSSRPNPQVAAVFRSPADIGPRWPPTSSPPCSAAVATGPALRLACTPAAPSIKTGDRNNHDVDSNLAPRRSVSIAEGPPMVTVIAPRGSAEQIQEQRFATHVTALRADRCAGSEGDPMRPAGFQPAPQVAPAAAERNTAGLPGDATAASTLASPRPYQDCVVERDFATTATTTTTRRPTATKPMSRFARQQTGMDDD